MLSRDFKEFVELLNSNKVEYLVVGAHALAVHGRPRFTGDLDLWIRPKRDNIENVLLALNEFGFASVGLTVEDFLAPQAVIQLGYPPGRIDLLTAIDGAEFDPCYRRRIDVEIAGLSLPVIGLDDFKANKRATGRLKDLADLEDLE
ncbi:MAG: hypothetical protein HYX63_15300 [Gammaproteobacteria bacterium]|nr:hypothetical protein [Gammaproteobacteria bacterium]